MLVVKAWRKKTVFVAPLPLDFLWFYTLLSPTFLTMLIVLFPLKNYPSFVERNLA